MRNLLAVIAGVLTVAVAARITATIPGSPVPQSAQTLAVLVVGALLGARLATAALVAYLALGALGAPVFADGGAGWFHLTGLTAGYLMGFVLAASLLGWLRERGRLGRLLPCAISMLVGHAVITTTGWAWLAASVGPGPAYAQGVAPFLVGGVLKSLVGAVVVVFALRWRPIREGPTDPPAGFLDRL